jgi:putative ABC transport system permease protein
MQSDLRHAVRLLGKRPVFTVVVTVTIALGIASTTTVFSVVQGVLLTPLPYEDPESLVMVWEHNVPRSRDRNVVSPANYLAWGERSDVFAELAAVVATSGTLTGVGEPERIGLMRASATLYPLLGVEPVVGRAYTIEEDVESESTVPVLLGHGFWERRFGGDPGVVGRAIELNERPAVVVGVLPEGFGFDVPVTFGFTGTQDVWLPFRFGEEARSFGGRYLQVVGRLGAGVSLAGAQARMTGLARQLEEEFPDRQTGWTVTVVPLQKQMVGDVERALIVILGAVGFVLLIACANVANLLMARANDRRQEMAVRAAMGASRMRVARQLLTESLVLASAGGVSGLLLSYAAVRGLIALGPDIPRLDAVGLNGAVVLFALGVTVITGILFGLAPVIRVLRSDLIGSLRERGVEGGKRESNRLRGALVVAEIALSLVLLVGAGLLLRSFGNLLAVDVGFDAERMLVADVQLPSARYDSTALARFYQDAVERVQALPGVRTAAAITFPPLAGAGSATSFWANDRPVPGPGQHPTADIRWVQRDFFRTLGVPVLAGRVFDESDHGDAPLRVVVSRALADDLWEGQDALGKTISMPWDDTLVAEIIGVVGDVRYQGPHTEPRSMIYWEHRQFMAFNQMSLIVRTDRDPLALSGAVRGVIQALDAQIPIYNVRSMESYLGDALARARFAMLAVGLFALVALALAVIGIYGVMSYVVGQRVHEIGIRLALGADPANVMGLVVRQGSLLVGIAVVVGAAGSLLLSRLLETMVFEVSTRDPVTFVGMSALLAVVALAACFIPALRASRVDPITAMRHE